MIKHGPRQAWVQAIIIRDFKLEIERQRYEMSTLYRNSDKPVVQLFGEGYIARG